MNRITFVAKADVADTRCLCDAGEVGDWDADQSVDGVHVVEFQRINDQAMTIGQLASSAGTIDGGIR